MKRYGRLWGLLLAVLLLTVSIGQAAARDGRNEMGGLTVLYTNDVHTYIHGDLTYARIAAYRDTLGNALLVDAGDYLQGTAYGSMDSGKTIVELMNAAGYDLATLGNHEFDYGMEGCMEAMAWAQFPHVSCNFYHEAQGVAGEHVLDSYRVFEVNGVRVAFVGITTPESFSQSTPAYFQDEKGNYIYGIAGGADGQELYASVQRAIDAASAQADIIIALGHLGDDASSKPWTASEVIANTTGLSAFIDGHSHSAIPGKQVADREGNLVTLTQTGCHLAAVGQMTIDADGTITTALLTAQDLADIEPDPRVQAMEDRWLAEVDGLLGKKIASSQIEFTVNFPDSEERAVRMAETNLGDFNADAYYWYMNEMVGMGADAAIMNGGGIRANAGAGAWSYLTCKNINTFGNVLCVVKVSGQTILDALEFGARYVGLTDQATGNRAENGGFLHVAGLTYEIDPTVQPTVQVDEKGAWQGGPEEYRVSNVKLYRQTTGRYEDLQLDSFYTVAGANYTLLDCGDGFTMFGQAEKVIDSVVEDYMALAAYAEGFADADGDGWPDIATSGSPLASYPGYLLDYEDPAGAGRITVLDPAGQECGSGAAPEGGAGGLYVVEAGDTLWRIAARAYGSGVWWQAIYRANLDTIQDPGLIYVGQVLTLPTAP